MSIHFQLVTPSRTVLSEELDSLTCPTTMGQITILPGHAPLVATLVPGELIARQGKDEHFLHVSGGFIQINPGSKVVALADEAEHYYEIDAEAAQHAKTRAEKLLSETKLSDEEYARVAATLERSLSRLHIARKHAHRHKAPITGEGVLEE